MEGIGLLGKDYECRCSGVYYDHYSHTFSGISVGQVNGEERGFRREGERFPQWQERNGAAPPGLCGDPHGTELLPKNASFPSVENISLGDCDLFSWLILFPGQRGEKTAVRGVSRQVSMHKPVFPSRCAAVATAVPGNSRGWVLFGWFLLVFCLVWFWLEFLSEKELTLCAAGTGRRQDR